MLKLAGCGVFPSSSCRCLGPTRARHAVSLPVCGGASASRLLLTRSLNFVCAQPYYLPTSVAVAGLAKTAFCFGASLSLFVALVAHKVAPLPLPEAPAQARGAEAGE